MWLQPISMSEVKTVEPLKDKTILVTRPRDQAVQLTQLLEQLGATVVPFPTIHIVPTSSWNDSDMAIANVDSYDGIIFTSVNAATYFLNRAKLVNTSIFDAFRKKAIYVVGEKTNRAVASFGLRGTTLKDVRDGRSLGQALLNLTVLGKRFLFPRGNLARAEVPSILREHGAVVNEVIVYETRPPSDIDSNTVKKIFSQKEVDLIVFFSPSSISNFLSLIPKAFLDRVHIAAIGQATAEVARKASLTVDIIADQPTTEGLVSSIVKFYE